MDGIIIDSEPLWREALILGFNEVGFDFTQDKCRITQGMRLMEVVEYWYNEQPWDNKTLEEVEQDILQKVTDLILEKGIAMEGVYESINYFRDKGFKIALASSSANSLINAVLDKLELTDAYEVINSAEHLLYGKPHPDIYIRTANELNVLPKNCWVIEDSFHGVLAGKSAMMKVIAIPEEANREQPRFACADYNLTSLNEVINLGIE